METLQAINGRRSIRKFKEQKVDRETIEKIVAAASYAPSWKNTQVVRYHVFDDPQIKSDIANKYTLGFAYNTGTLGACAPGCCSHRSEGPQRHGEGWLLHHIQR